MRRLTLSLIATCSIAVLSACGSGGYAFSGSGGKITSIQFFSSSGQVNDYFLSPSGTSPLTISAQGYNGTGTFTNVVPDTTFTWAVSYAPEGTTYSKGASPNGSGTCGTPGNLAPLYYALLEPVTTSGGGVPVPTPDPVLGPIPPSGGDASPQFAGFDILSPTQAATSVYLAPPIDPTKIPAIVPITPAGTGTNYCLFVVATHVGDGVKGSVTVVVSNSP
jgi:hypothetical protein